VTDRRVDLTAFGHTNATVFARLLTSEAGAPTLDGALAGPGRPDG